jgi:hypothetical protein
MTAITFSRKFNDGNFGPWANFGLAFGGEFWPLGVNTLKHHHRPERRLGVDEQGQTVAPTFTPRG